MADRLITSESVTEGHPDKLADQVSDAVLDAVLAEDPNGRVACEVMTTTGLIVVGGELTTETYVDIPGIARSVFRDAGYTRAKYGFDADTCSVMLAVKEQSPEIAAGVDCSYEVRGASGDDDPLDLEGAGDQGMVYGYATDETPELMPLPIQAAHLLARGLARARKDGTLPELLPDGKTQLAVRYEDDRPVEIEKMLISTQHRAGTNDNGELKARLWEHVVEPLLLEHYSDICDLRALQGAILVNPSGSFVVGGPGADAGLTGRKIIVDTYGGAARHGGGAFSGKDPSKVDRSAAYAARHVAKNIVAAGLARRCEIQISYAIGVAHPFAVNIDAFGTETVPIGNIVSAVEQCFDLRPAAIIRDLDLRRPIYRPTAAYGHFGREEAGFTWEGTGVAEELALAAGPGDIRVALVH